MSTNGRNQVYKLTIGGLLLAVGIIISRVFHVFGDPSIGKMFQPMHISVFIAGLYLGIYYGSLIGFLTPLISSLFGMPMFPFNIIMALELGAYGLFAGLFVCIFRRFSKTRAAKLIIVYISLILSMIMGRIIYALALFVMAKFFGMDLPAPESIIASTIVGLPGIIIQLALVPVLVFALYKAGERYNN